MPSQSIGVPIAPIRRKVIQQRFLLPDGKDPFRTEYTVRSMVHFARGLLIHKIILDFTKSLFIAKPYHCVRLNYHRFVILFLIRVQKLSINFN